MTRLDSGIEFRELLSFIVSNLKLIVEKQDSLLAAYIETQNVDSDDKSTLVDDGVELF